MQKQTPKNIHLLPKVVSSSLAGCNKSLIISALLLLGSKTVANAASEFVPEPLFSPMDFLVLAGVMAVIFWCGWVAGTHRGRSQGRAQERNQISRSLYREVARQTRVRL